MFQAMHALRAMTILTTLGAFTLMGCASSPAGSSDGDTSQAELSQPLTLAQVKSGLTRSFLPVKSSSNPLLFDALVVAKGATKIIDTQAAAASADKHDAVNPAFLAKLANPRGLELTFDYYMYAPVFEDAPQRSSGKLGVLAGKVPGEMYVVMEREDVPASYYAQESQDIASGKSSYALSKYYYFQLSLAEGVRDPKTGVLDTRWLNFATFGDNAPFATKQDGTPVDPYAAAQNTCFTMSSDWWSPTPSCATIRLVASSTYFGQEAVRGDVFCGTFRDLYDPNAAVNPQMQAQGDADCAWALGGASPRVTTAAACPNGKPTGFTCVAPPKSNSSFDLARCAPECAQ